MASKKSSKAVAAMKEDANSSDFVSQGNVNAILAAIGSQGDELKKLIEDKMTALSGRLDALDATLVNLQSEQAGVKQKIVEIEGALNGTDSRLGEVEKVCDDLRAENKSLWAKLNDLEGRSHRLNLKFVGIMEGEERGRPSVFISDLITELFGRDNFPKPVKIDRAHRALLPKPSEGQRPRTIIARIHNDRDKDLILRLSREKFPLEYKGKRIYIFPDYIPEVAARRRAFSSVTKVLREAGLKWSLRFPAKLMLHHNGREFSFESPEEAKKFVGNLSNDSA
ncbi:putative transposase element L1Md-A101/L1Md-A102/L1Md-A2 [Labeo rohita]|uniref:Putative transposase element L1Md-A101/L1Md-A102/L1Md-A2 n=1 Tax=Labeo rohita TaxID=84645 RepID=A0A498NJN7_LABRO|nr:putative transposase element L1Md-A101/L1Md-A102/L1Md-A2 [Labeo rohita]